MELNTKSVYIYYIISRAAPSPPPCHTTYSISLLSKRANKSLAEGLAQTYEKINLEEGICPTHSIYSIYENECHCTPPPHGDNDDDAVDNVTNLALSIFLSFCVQSARARMRLLTWLLNIQRRAGRRLSSLPPVKEAQHARVAHPIYTWSVERRRPALGRVVVYSFILYREPHRRRTLCIVLHRGLLFFYTRAIFTLSRRFQMMRFHLSSHTVSQHNTFSRRKQHAQTFFKAGANFKHNILLCVLKPTTLFGGCCSISRAENYYYGILW